MSSETVKMSEHLATQSSNIFTPDQQAMVSSLIEDAVRKVRDEMHSHNSGLNRKNGELTRELRDRETEIRKLRTEKANDSESWQAERERQLAEINAERTALITERNKAKAEAFAVKNSIPVDLISMIPMADETTMNDSLNKLKGVIEADRAAVIEAQKREIGDSPTPASSSGAVPKKSKSEMTAGEAQVFVAEHGIEAYRALPA